jgi:hypothetical protein
VYPLVRIISLATTEEGSVAAPQNTTTTFLDDSRTVEAEVPAIARLPSSFYSQSETIVTSDINQFLGKPIVWLETTLSNTDTASTFPAIRLPHDMVIKPIYLNKFQGYLGFRADIVLRFTVNAQRF